MSGELKVFRSNALCPHCGFDSEIAMEMQQGTAPSPGDVSLCHACCGLSLFADDLTLRLPTRAEFIALRKEPDWETVIKATIAIKTVGGPKPPKKLLSISAKRLPFSQRAAFRCQPDFRPRAAAARGCALP